MLSLPDSQIRNILLVMTYAVVLFAVIVQGGTIARLIDRMKRRHGNEIRGVPE